MEYKQFETQKVMNLLQLILFSLNDSLLLHQFKKITYFEKGPTSKLCLSEAKGDFWISDLVKNPDGTDV